MPRTSTHALETMPFRPNWEGLVRNILRKGTPDRVYNIELFHDGEVEDAIVQRFGLDAHLSRADPDYTRWRHLAMARFLGFDTIRVGLRNVTVGTYHQSTEDTAGLPRSGGRNYQDEHKGPITTWDEFEQFPWPDPTASEVTADLEWWQEHLPEDMCIMGSGGFAHFAEYLCWLMGYETLCYALYDDRDLVAAIAERLCDLYRVCAQRLLEFDRVKILFGSDDMGYKTGPLLSPADLRAFVLPGHRMCARMAHEAGRPYLLHSCGNLSEIMGDLVDDVRIDARHSFEDTIEDVRDAKKTYGQRIALLGGIDVDFLCRSDEESIRQRVRDTLAICQPGGGYCLGTGNSVCNYIPLDSYLAMLDEGRRWTG